MNEPCYLVADAYYASGIIVKGVLAQKHDLITRSKFHRTMIELGFKQTADVIGTLDNHLPMMDMKPLKCLNRNQ